MHRAVSVVGIECEPIDYMEAEVIALERDAEVLIRASAFNIYVGHDELGAPFQIIASPLGQSFILRFPFATRAASS